MRLPLEPRRPASASVRASKASGSDAVQVPIEVGEGAETGIVHPGDLVCADGSGVVVVPNTVAGEIAELVDRITAMDALVVADVTAGMPLRVARARHGYNMVGR